MGDTGGNLHRYVVDAVGTGYSFPTTETSKNLRTSRNTDWRAVVRCTAGSNSCKHSSALIDEVQFLDGSVGADIMSSLLRNETLHRLAPSRRAAVGRRAMRRRQKIIPYRPRREISSSSRRIRVGTYGVAAYTTKVFGRSGSTLLLHCEEPTEIDAPVVAAVAAASRGQQAGIEVQQAAT